MPDRAAHSIRAARRGDADRLSGVFGAAFQDTATFRWLIEDDAARARLLPAFFRGSIQHLQARPGAILLAVQPPDGTIVAGATWAPPGRWKTPWWRALLSAPRLLRAADAATLREFGRKGPALERALAAAHPAEPHWYLAGLAVAPQAQGTGAGSALVRAGLRRSRAAGLPAYLECVEALVPYYERFGFSVTREIPIGGRATDHVGMRAA